MAKEMLLSAAMFGLICSFKLFIWLKCLHFIVETTFLKEKLNI